MNNTRWRWLGAFFCLVLSLAPGGLTRSSSAAEVNDPGPEGDGNFTVGSEYKIDRDLTACGNPKGKYFEFKMRLAHSKIFRGDDPTLELARKAVRQERRIFVYVPVSYKDGTEAPLLVIHDGPGQMGLIRCTALLLCPKASKTSLHLQTSTQG